MEEPSRWLHDAPVAAQNRRRDERLRAPCAAHRAGLDR